MLPPPPRSGGRHLAETSHVEAGSDSSEAAQDAVRKVSLTPDTATLAARLQIAGHVDDQTAEDLRAQGNVELLELGLISS